jgi:DNA-binding CsgD family transcriptional regulator
LFALLDTPMKLVDRDSECATLDQLVEAVGTGESRALLLSGEPGVGKTALLEYLQARASACRVVRVVGVQSEMELAFAALHQLCSPLLDRLPGIPLPQRDALRTALGMSAGPVPDRFLVGLAVLSLLSDAAEQQSLLCLVDAEQWLDRASAQVLGFVARRLGADSLGLVFAARVPSSDLAGMPELKVGRLRAAGAQALLDAQLIAPLDTRVRDQILAEARGNPLALLESVRGVTAQQLAGGFGLPGTIELAGGIDESFRRRVDVLPDQTRLLLLIAAAEPLGDPAMVMRAAARLGIGADAATPAVQANLIEFATRVSFRHPVVRTVVYGSASRQQRQAVHAALAEVTDPQLDPERRAWHRAQAAPGPDDDVAADLERCADRAQARGGMAAAAAFLERATALTLDPRRRTERALGAATAHLQAGALDAVRRLLSVAETGAMDDLQRAQIDLIAADLAFVTNRGSDASPLLLKAARRLEPVDPELSRATYLRSFTATTLSGRLTLGGGVLEVAHAATCAPPPVSAARAPDLLLKGLAAHFEQGYEAGLSTLRDALDVLGVDMSVDEQLRCHWLACVVATQLWDDERWHRLSARHVQLSRSIGALIELSLDLGMRAVTLLFEGDLTGSAALVAEHQVVMDVTGSRVSSPAEWGLAAFRSGNADAVALIAAAIDEANGRGEGLAIALAEWANAVLNNSLGNYEQAMQAAQRGSACPLEMTIPRWAAVELVEAAVRSGHREVASDALDQLVETTTPAGTDWARGVEARSRALLADGETAERFYLESIACLGRTRVRTELARAHLPYGEWLRRERRRVDARTQLRIAHTMLEEMGMETFADRAARELKATGEIARKRSVATHDQGLTAQEAQIAGLARDGLSNPEIATRLFISARTVQYHLKNVFIKLGISSRNQLDRVFPR